MRNKIHRQALLIGYYIKQELNTEPTTELIEKVINEHTNINELTDLLEKSIAPDKREDFEREIEELSHMPGTKEEHAPRTVENALTPEQIETIKRRKIEELNEQEAHEHSNAD